MTLFFKLAIVLAIDLKLKSNFSAIIYVVMLLFWAFSEIICCAFYYAFSCAFSFLPATVLLRITVKIPSFWKVTTGYGLK